MDNQANEILVTVIDYIEKLKLGILDAAELFQNYEENKGATLLEGIANGIEWLSDALLVINKLNNEEISQINSKLSEIITALENQDYILTGDLLQYELLPILEEISEKLK